jgi:hypothetical protein
MNPVAFALAYALLFCGALVSIGRVQWGDGFDFAAPETLALLFLGVVLATLDAIVVGILGAAMRRQAAADGMVDAEDPIVQRRGEGGVPVGPARLVAMALLVSAPVIGGVLGFVYPDIATGLRALR